MADASYQPKLYRKQGGNEQVVASGGLVTVESGGAINIKSGAALQNDGTPMDLSAGIATSTSSSTAELDTLHSVVAGTSSASKAAVLGANKNLDILALPVSGLKIGAGAGTAVTTTAAELNVLSSVTPGTVAASKAVVVDASKRVTEVNVATGGKCATVDADGFTASGVILPQHVFITYPINQHASKVIHNLFTARSAYQVVNMDYTPDIAQGGALTATLVKATGTSTPASATTPLHIAGAIDLNGAAHTVQPLTPTVTSADLQLAAGDRIAIVLSAAMTVGSGNVTIKLKRI